ncbi:MAG: hypothetical protein RID25_17380, partial [Cyclobacteriaceae bacterium]
IRQGGNPSLMAVLCPILADIVYFLAVRCLKKMSPEDENRRIFIRITEHSSPKDHSWDRLLKTTGIGQNPKKIPRERLSRIGSTSPTIIHSSKIDL